MLASMPAQAEEFEYEGIKYYSLTDSTAQVGRNSDVQGDVVIPDSVDFNGKRLKVTAIGDNAFTYEWEWNEKGITSIQLPKGLTSIGSYAFCYQRQLKAIDIPETVTRIKANAFEGSGLQSVVLGGSLETISREAFIGCNSLEDVYLRTDKLDKCYGTIFSPVSYYLGTLHVPEGQKNKYMHLDFWKSFENIVEENTSGTEYCLIDVTSNYYDTYVNDEEIFIETHLEQPKGSPLTVRFTFNKNKFGDGYVRYLRGMQVNGVEHIQDCTDGTLTISEVTEDLDITVDIGVCDASLAIYQDEHGGLELPVAPNIETIVTIMPAEGYRANVTLGPWMKTYQWGNPWKETYTASDNDPLSLRLWLRDDEEIKIKYVKK